MSGHSKWSTIKHQKAAEDSKRSALFTKIAKKIRVAVKAGNSGDINNNSFLRTVVDEAKSANMPMDNIKRAIERAFGSADGELSEEVVYEAYGVGGVGLMITAITDNRNRTAGEIKNMLEKSGAKLGGPGSVSYMRSITPQPVVEITKEQKTQLNLLVSGLNSHDDVVEVWTNVA